MTMMLATITPSACWISQDSACWNGNARWGHLPKVGCIPGKLLLGSCADDLTAGMLYGLAVVELGDVDALAEQLPRRFASWDANVTAMPFQAIFCGWSRRYRRLVGYLVEHATKMEPKLLLSGHHVSPQCDDRFPGYDAAADLSDRAERGERVEEFHAVVGHHIKAVAGGGGYADRGHVGGWLQCGTITRSGTVIRDLCDLDIGDLDIGALDARAAA